MWLKTQNEILCHTNVFLLCLHSHVENVYFSFKCKKIHYRWAWKEKPCCCWLSILNFPRMWQNYLLHRIVYHDNIHQNDDLMSIVKAFWPYMNVKILPGCLLYSLMILKIAFQWNWKQAIFEKKITWNFTQFEFT